MSACVNVEGSTYVILRRREVRCVVSYNTKRDVSGGSGA